MFVCSIASLSAAPGQRRPLPRRAVRPTPTPKIAFADAPQTYRAQYFEIDQRVSIAAAARAICGI
jgi:hypothetical protein